MRRMVLPLLLTLTLAGSLFAERRHSSMNVRISDDNNYEELTRCDDLQVSFAGVRAVRAEETVPVSALKSLRVHAAENGGIRVVGWDGNGYSVTACKAAALTSSLSNIHIAVQGNEVSATGGGDDDSIVYFLVRAPRNAVLELDAHNGPIGVDKIVGSVSVSTENGPVSVKSSSGTITVEAKNGPISLAGSSGAVKLHAVNGPLSVKLSGAAWEGGSLDARTENGPLSLKLPNGYQSGIVVESDGHSPVSCHLDDCRGLRRAARHDDEEDDMPRHIELGHGPMLLHLQTVNGPVSVKQLD